MDCKVLVCYAGGTFGMKYDKEGKLVPQPLEKIKTFIIAHSNLYDHEAGFPVNDVKKHGATTLYQQLSPDEPKSNTKAEKVKKILYEFDGLSQDPIDSSSAGPKDWSRLAEKILDNLDKYVGFVILHGTDTMAFTASALSFFLGNIKKPVIVTGAQLPIFHPRSDGLCNLISSLLMAGYFSDREILQKVMLCYQNKLYHGNRVMKVDCDSFEVFDSVEVGPIASLETTIKLMEEMQVGSGPKNDGVSRTKKVKFMLKQEPDVRVLHFYPGITEQVVRGVLDKAKGVVLETFGSGNVPNEDWLKKLLIKAHQDNVLMLNCTQVLRGTVVSVYAASKILTEAKVIRGYDITPVAGMAKMVWVLKLDVDHQTRCEIMSHSVYGESCAPRLPFNLEIDVNK